MCFKFLLGSSLLVLKSLIDVEGGGGESPEQSFLSSTCNHSSSSSNDNKAIRVQIGSIKKNTESLSEQNHLLE